MTIALPIMAAVVSFAIPALRTGDVGEAMLSGRWAALVVLFGWLFVRAARSSNKTSSDRDVLVSGLVLLFAASASSVLGRDPALSVTKLVPAALTVAAFTLALPRCATPRVIGMTVRSLALFLGGLCVVAVVLAVALGVVGRYGGRLGSISNPNTVGMIGMVAAALLAPRALSGRLRSTSDLGTKIMFAVAVATIWWSGSRASFLGLCLSVLVWLVASRSGWEKIAVFLFAMIFLMLLRPGIITQVTGSMERFLIKEHGFTYSREGVWQASLEGWRASPVLGHGYGVSGSVFVWSRMTGSAGSLKDGSGYLAVLESLGIFGAAAFLYLLTQVARRVWKIVRADSDRLLWIRPGVAAALGWMALLINGAAEPWILGPGSLQHLVFWLLAGCVITVSGWVGAMQPVENRVLAHDGLRARQFVPQAVRRGPLS